MIHLKRSRDVDSWWMAEPGCVFCCLGYLLRRGLSLLVNIGFVHCVGHPFIHSFPIADLKPADRHLYRPFSRHL